MFQLFNVLKKVYPQEPLHLVEQYCGDEFAHGNPQVAISPEQFEESLIADTLPTQMCYMVEAPGFWEMELHNNLHFNVSNHVRQFANIPIYVYALKEGNSYKVVVASRFVKEFYTQNKEWSYYPEVISAVTSVPLPAQTTLFCKSMYSGDLVRVLDTLRPSGYCVYKVLP